MVARVEMPALSAEDRAILDLEGPEVAGHTCKVVIVGHPAPSLAELQERIAARVDRAPLLRARLGGTAESPCWTEAPDFAVADHVVERPGAPLEPSGLATVVARIFEQRLSRARPLWRIDVLRLEDGRAALVWRIHHALADGSAALRYGREVLWDEPDDGPQTPTRAGAAHSTPSPAIDAEDDRRRRHHLAGFLRRELIETPGDRSPFDGRIGSARAVAFAAIPLRPFHDAAKRVERATLNDALLAVIAGAVRRWIETHDGRLGRLRLRVPVSLHEEGDAAGNRDSFITLPVDLEEKDPIVRLRTVHTETTARKSAQDAERIDTLRHTLEARSQRLGELAERLIGGPRSFALCISNVRGPQGRLRIGAAPVESLHTLAEIGRRHALRVSAVSAMGSLQLGFCADRTLIDDVETIAAAAETEAEALIAAE
jgi:WS/DGAT/MGAT family acyltransferase